MSFAMRFYLILAVLLVTACGGGGGSSPAFNCTIPCLAGSPTLSVSSVSSATGGTVTLEFTLTGDAENVVVFLMSENPLSMNSAGNNFLTNVQGGVPQQIDIVVNAATPLDTYYPNIGVTANQLNTGSLHYLDPTKSSTAYTYNEVVSGNASVPVLSPYTIPKLTVTN